MNRIEAQKPITAIILAAGQGTRMKSDIHKVLHPVGGKSMILHLLETVSAVGISQRIIVIGAHADQVQQALPGETFVTQHSQQGTGHAVMVCKETVNDNSGDLLVLFGDTPLIPQQIIEAMIVRKNQSTDTGIVVLGFEAKDPGRYGRLVLDSSGQLDRIVEYKDATENERALTLCNSGVMLIDGKKAYDWLDNLSADNAAKEYYLTDLVALARTDGRSAAVVKASESDVQGVNTRADLADCEAAFQQRMRSGAMASGVTLIAPETVFFSADTEIDQDVVVEPHVVFGAGVRVESGATIKSFSHLEGCIVRPGASVGPYSRLRPGADIGEEAKVGNFVEVKKATLGRGAKASHLTYLGDATVGADANIGAGTITCNYDGYLKHQTRIGDGAFIGSNSALVAPVIVEDGAIVGAGSVITKAVSTDSIAVTRAPQKEIKGSAAKFRKRQAAKKAALKAK